MTTLPNYNASPTPQGGSGAYGAVPGAVSVPPSAYQQTTGAIPSLTKTGTAAADVIGSKVAGQVTPETQNLLQNKAASMGIASGAGTFGTGNSFSTNNFLATLGLDSEALQQQGVTDYLSFLTGVGGTMTDPNLAASVAESNALNAAAPNPTAAAETLQNDYLQALNPNAWKGPAGGSNYSVQDWMGTGQSIAG